VSGGSQDFLRGVENHDGLLILVMLYGVLRFLFFSGGMVLNNNNGKKFKLASVKYPSIVVPVSPFRARRRAPYTLLQDGGFPEFVRRDRRNFHTLNEGCRPIKNGVRERARPGAVAPSVF
jgi:hypothetical protein